MIQISGGLASKHMPILPLVNVGSHTLSCQFHVNFKYIASGLCLAFNLFQVVKGAVTL